MNEQLNTISIHPNPVLETLNISSNVNIRDIKIYNIIGKLVHTASTTSFSVSKLDRGVYFLNTTTIYGVKQIRFIKH